MASEESWVGITDVADHLSVAKDSIYRWVDSKDFPAHRVRPTSALPALRSRRMGKIRGWECSQEPCN